MMQEVTGDILAVDADIIAHQVNYAGVMGAGVADAIRKKLLTRYGYEKYKTVCADAGSKLLGHVLYLRGRTGQIVANCFSQNDYPDYAGNLTSYGALARCVDDLAKLAKEKGYTVAIPWHYGCGIAGGDWLRVYSIFEDYFYGPDTPKLLIVRRENEFG